MQSLVGELKDFTLNRQDSVSNEGFPSEGIKITNCIVRLKIHRGEKYLNEFRKIRNLADGTFGRVKLYLHKNGTHYALKKCSKTLLRKKREYSSIGGRMNFVTALDKVYSEVKMLTQLRHPNICRLFEFIEDDNEVCPSV